MDLTTFDELTAVLNLSIHLCINTKIAIINGVVIKMYRIMINRVTKKFNDKTLKKKANAKIKLFTKNIDEIFRYFMDKL